MRLTNVLIFSIIAILFSSCSHKYYAPDTPNLLMIQKKGEIKVSGGIGSSNITSLQAGYSPIKHIAINGSYFSGSGSRSGGGITGSFFEYSYVDPWEISGKGTVLSGSIGTYYFIESKNKPSSKDYASREGLLLDIYAGYGEAVIANNYKYGPSSQFKFQKYYLQPGIHLQSKFASISYVTRFSNVNYFDGYYTGELDALTLVDIQHIETQNPFNFIEQAIRMRLGVKQFDIYIDYTHSSLLGNKKLNYISGVFAMGFTSNISELFKMKKTKI